jgi:O-antigen ligase/polysaccharide polymerase Wzy-like membrane protein
VQILVVGLVVWAALAVSHVDELNIPIGRRMRWVALAALTFVALAYAITRPVRRFRPDSLVLLAAAFPMLALASAAWSPDVSLTLGRALTLLFLFVAARAIAFGSHGSERAARGVLLALLVGAAAVAVGGGIDFIFEPDRALIPATIGSPARYNGLGGNPNMMAMLLAVCLPLAVWAFLVSRSALAKAACVATFLVFDASIVASGSRGAILGSAAGLAALGLALPVRRRLRVALVAGAVGLLVLNIGLTQLPQPAESNPVLNPEFGSRRPLGPNDAQFILPLESEIGYPAEGAEAESRPRSLFTTSGRTAAWEGALGQVLERPALGYGFGTEDRVFVDRFYAFYSSNVENSFLGTLLQLGAVGLGLLLALIAAFATRGIRALGSLDGSTRLAAAACLGVVAAGAVVAVTQSYLTSVGNPATTPFWLSAFLLAALGGSNAARHDAPRLDEGEADEREIEGAQRHREARLDVV